MPKSVSLLCVIFDGLFVCLFFVDFAQVREPEPGRAEAESGRRHRTDRQPGPGQRAAGGPAQNPDPRPGDVHQLHPR